MKLVFTHENRLVVGNIRNILDAAGIETIYRNEFAGGAMGEVSPFDIWLEIWLRDEADYPKAMALLAELQQPADVIDWRCDHCGEANTAAFELCWNCQADRASGRGGYDS